MAVPDYPLGTVGTYHRVAELRGGRSPCWDKSEGRKGSCCLMCEPGKGQGGETGGLKMLVSRAPGGS